MGRAVPRAIEPCGPWGWPGSINGLEGDLWGYSPPKPPFAATRCAPHRPHPPRRCRSSTPSANAAAIRRSERHGGHTLTPATPARRRGRRPRRRSCPRGSAARGRTAARRRRGSAARSARRRTRSRRRARGGRDDDPVALDLELLQPLGLPGEHRVGQPLERLAQHHEAVAVDRARPEVEVAQPAAPAPVPPLGGEDHEVERVPRLDLQPAGPAAAGGVGRVQCLDDDALVAGGQRGVEVGLGLAPGRR